MKKAICGILLWPLLLYSQQKPLQVGDTIPAHLLSSLPRISPSSSGGPLIILDFFATWCTACLRSFPHLDSLQQEFPGALSVVLVNAASTGDDAASVAAFFKKRKNTDGLPFRFPVLVGDTIFSSLFPHRLIPHYVWIYNNKVKAVTASDQLTADNIVALINGRPLRLAQKNDDLAFNGRLPLFINGNAGSGEARLRFRSLLTVRIDGLAQGQYRDISGDSLSRLCFVNTPLLQLYRRAFHCSLPANRLIVSMADSARFIASDDQEWTDQNTFCYELLMPPVPVAAAYKFMQQDLRRYFGFTASVRKRKTLCLILVADSSRLPSESPPPAQYDAHDLQWVSMPSLLDRINRLSVLPVLDETHLTAPICLSRTSVPLSFQVLADSLRSLGFTFREEYREIDMFVITKEAF